MAHPMETSNRVTPFWSIMASFQFTEADERRSESGFQHAGSAARAVMRLLRLVHCAACLHQPRSAGSRETSPVWDVHRRSRLPGCNPAVWLVELALRESGPARRLRRHRIAAGPAVLGGFFMINRSGRMKDRGSTGCGSLVHMSKEPRSRGGWLDWTAPV